MRQIWNKVKTRRRKGDKIITMQRKALQVSHILIWNICFSSSLLISTCGHEVRLHLLLEIVVVLSICRNYFIRWDLITSWQVLV